MVDIRQEFIEQAAHLARGAEVLPGGIEELAVKLQHAHDTKTPLRVKLGMDPTRPDLHLGHTVVMRKLREFQKLGHQIVLIVGGATAMVGDPSGKSETRPALTKEQVDENAKSYFEQMSKVLDVSKAEVTNNADWLHNMSFVDMLKLASQITVAQMMTRDDFAKRYAEGKPIAIHEFFYPLMQAYDSVEIDADIELGGTDQRFNTLLGRQIQEAYGKKYPQMVFLLPLIEGTDGLVKMSKTYPEHCISLTDSAKDMFGKLMSIPDTLIVKYYTLLTDVSTDEIRKIEEQLNDSTVNPRDIKMKLAFMITEEYHGKDGAQHAQDEFINVVSNKGIPDDIEEITGMNGKGILDVLVELGFVQSKGEAKRLIQGGGVKINGEKIADMAYTLKLDEDVVLQAGKRKFAKLLK
ncbi:TPA: tyrosine--tRNA ligase [Candidatus Scatousia excrementigallinarum]|uniref:Tyrosine--tRNA ligase n=1 Tax=Candidatus Scatousia excrementigallinarum TaxID=2840935 RepID=A0A9D1EYS7_9BACT|nr:tyrosine--tRNA ligase [Candidatus Scatousia excrementigallinarum]